MTDREWDGFSGISMLTPVRARSIALLITLVGLVCSHPARAIVFQDTTAQNTGLGSSQGLLDGEARLIIGLSDGSTVGCSGSLLAGGQYVLTAAHCVTGDSGALSASNVSLDFANVGLTLTATRYLVDPVWNGSLTNGGDLALISLGAPVTSIAGYQLDTSSSAMGQVVALAGYGDTGVGSTGYQGSTFGTLYYGQNTYDGLYGIAPTVYGYDFDQYGTTTYNVYGGGAVGSNEVMIAPGDSGGGSFINVGGTLELVAVHDFISCVQQGCTPTSSFGQIGGDTSLYADASFVNSILVPEPASLWMIATGMAGLAGLHRQRPAGCSAIAVG
jgi:hypothetical protein